MSGPAAVHVLRQAEQARGRPERAVVIGITAAAETPGNVDHFDRVLLKPVKSEQLKETLLDLLM